MGSCKGYFKKGSAKGYGSTTPKRVLYGFPMINGCYLSGFPMVQVC